MPVQDTQPQKTKKGSGPQWILFALVMGVLVLSSAAFFEPIAQSTQISQAEKTPLVTVDPASSGTITVTSTLEVQDLPPTAEEIGYTDGIIFCSTVLVLILLVGTLREIARQKNR